MLIAENWARFENYVETLAVVAKPAVPSRWQPTRGEASASTLKGCLTEALNLIWFAILKNEQ